MLTAESILQAVEALVEREMPGTSCYRTRWPEEVQFPCVLLQAAESPVEDGGRDIVEITRRFRMLVQGGPERDDTLFLDEVSGLFRRGYLRVGDRALHLNVTVEEPGESGEHSLRLLLHYFDRRQEASEAAPLMEEIHYNNNWEG